ncbi:MAG: V-type ATP synthase subunit E [Sphaerochaeta sp.]|jgi:V/A-type H+-transporting ATPase subunit E|uniref:V-type ATP synthase subunit E n=1 Tax=Sphaerochaeta sp. TaxID=1972642 RepID=UPI002FC80AC1
MDTTDNRLLSGILEQAELSAKKTQEDAQDQVANILAQAQKRADKEVAAEQRTVEQKLQQIQLRLQANMGTAKRKASLRKVDESYQQVMSRVLSALDAKTVSAYLSQWIAEAAIGLDLVEVKVASSHQCPVTEEHLAKATALVRKATGSEITLHLDPKPIRGLGVIVSSMDDTISFNNQVEIRLRRFDRDIRSLIQEHA